jgi:putative membrane protein
MMSKRSSVKIFIVASALAAGGVTIAQQPGGAAASQQGPTNQSAAPSAPAMPGDSASDNSTQSFADQSFLRKTMEDNVAQEQMGQLAAQKSSSDDVKQFGEKMAQIHEQLTNQIMPVAKKLGVDQPKEPSKKDRQEIDKMQALSGPDFDAAFIRAMLKDQQNDLKGFKDEAQAGQDPNVQQLAKMDEPVLSQHLQLLQQIAQTHNVTADNKK